MTLLGAAILLTTAACGGKNDEESPGGTKASASPSAEPSVAASESPSPTHSAATLDRAAAVKQRIALDEACKPMTTLDPVVDVPVGRTFELTVKADAKGCSVYVDGYNKSVGVGDGEALGVAFVADKVGTFRVGLEEKGPKLFDLRVLTPAADRFDADTAATLAITLDEDCKLTGKVPTPKVPQGLGFVLTVTSKTRECEVDLRDGATPIKTTLRDGGVIVYSYVADDKGTFPVRIDGNKRFDLVVK